jgi:hypothetical protein
VAEQIENPADVGVSYFSRQEDFALEARHGVGLHQDLRPDGFYSDTLAQLLIVGLIHLTHAPTGNEADNPKSSG